MAIQVADNFQYLGQKPLDARVKYATVADMAAVAASSLYDGIMAYVVATEKNYQWKSTNTVDPTLGKWREFQSGGGGDLTGRAKSTAIAPVFDETVTYAAGDRVTYEDELYVFNKAHTGAWAAADADKSDVDTLTKHMPATDMSEVASPMPGVMSRLPVLFDESGTEQVVGWYKLANGTKKPIYRKSAKATNTLTAGRYNLIAIPQDAEMTRFVSGYTDSGVSLPYVAPGDYCIIIYKYNGYYVAECYEDRSDFGNQYVTIEYTKTTDTPQ